MSLIIRAVRNKGDQERERVVLKATEDCNLAGFMIRDCTFNNGRETDEVRHTYWFDEFDIEQGDLVIVYTKSGKKSSKKNSYGTQSHFFYWGLDTHIWNVDGDTAYLFKVFEIDSKPV